MNVKYDTIIFDLDGTLLDTSRGIFNSVRYAERIRTQINTLRSDLEQLKSNATIKFNKYLFG